MKDVKRIILSTVAMSAFIIMTAGIGKAAGPGYVTGTEDNSPMYYGSGTGGTVDQSGSYSGSSWGTGAGGTVDQGSSYSNRGSVNYNDQRCFGSGTGGVTSGQSSSYYQQQNQNWQNQNCCGGSATGGVTDQSYRSGTSSSDTYQDQRFYQTGPATVTHESTSTTYSAPGGLTDDNSYRDTGNKFSKDPTYHGITAGTRRENDEGFSSMGVPPSVGSGAGMATGGTVETTTTTERHFYRGTPDVGTTGMGTGGTTTTTTNMNDTSMQRTTDMSANAPRTPYDQGYTYGFSQGYNQGFNQGRSDMYTGARGHATGMGGGGWTNCDNRSSMSGGGTGGFVSGSSANAGRGGRDFYNTGFHQWVERW